MQDRFEIPKKASVSDLSVLIRDFVANMGFPCIGAKTALAKGQIQISVADSIFSSAKDHKILDDLYGFVAEYKKNKAIFRSLIVIFNDRISLSEKDFETALWMRLQSIHDKDIYAWDPSVSEDPADKTFSFSAGGKSFYIVGIHSGSSRKARRFPLPGLVFNLHEQFEALRETGQYQTMKSIIKRRDKAFSGSVNPMLEDFGENSEAIQYSGRHVQEEWKCPFQNKAIGNPR